LSREEFKILFQTYFEDIRRYILYRSGDEHIATDIAQDTFLKIWEKQIEVESKTAKALLLKIASNLYINRYNHEQLGYRFFNTFIPNETNVTPEDELNYNELKSAYESALKTMPEKQRTVFLMNRIDDLKYREIAEELGLSVKAIEKRMSLALEHLKAHLKNNVSGLILYLGFFRPIK
jgi:RNA polymerase sigma-70 factor (ECF subfamily)